MYLEVASARKRLLRRHLRKCSVNLALVNRANVEALAATKANAQFPIDLRRGDGFRAGRSESDEKPVSIAELQQSPFKKGHANILLHRAKSVNIAVYSHGDRIGVC